MSFRTFISLVIFAGVTHISLIVYNVYMSIKEKKLTKATVALLITAAAIVVTAGYLTYMIYSIRG